MTTAPNSQPANGLKVAWSARSLLAPIEHYLGPTSHRVRVGAFGGTQPAVRRREPFQREFAVLCVKTAAFDSFKCHDVGTVESACLPLQHCNVSFHQLRCGSVNVTRWDIKNTLTAVAREVPHYYCLMKGKSMCSVILPDRINVNIGQHKPSRGALFLFASSR
jgi:hypothetical protein